MKFAATLNSNAIERMQNKISKLTREDMTQLRVRIRKAKLAEAMLPIEPFSCTDLSIGVGLAGMIIAKAPWGVGLVISGAGLGPDIAEKAGVC